MLQKTYIIEGLLEIVIEMTYCFGLHPHQELTALRQSKKNPLDELIKGIGKLGEGGLAFLRGLL